MNAPLRVWLLLLSAVLLLSACGGGKEPNGWAAEVVVKENTATVTVKVPGMRLGKDYHPHLRLNGGPEVMQYTPTYTFYSLQPGDYKVIVGLTDAEHRPIAGLADKEVLFQVP